MFEINKMMDAVCLISNALTLAEHYRQITFETEDEPLDEYTPTDESISAMLWRLEGLVNYYDEVDVRPSYRNGLHARWRDINVTHVHLMCNALGDYHHKAVWVGVFKLESFNSFYAPSIESIIECIEEMLKDE